MSSCSTHVLLSICVYRRKNGQKDRGNFDGVTYVPSYSDIEQILHRYPRLRDIPRCHTLITNHNNMSLSQYVSGCTLLCPLQKSEYILILC